VAACQAALLEVLLVVVLGLPERRCVLDRRCDAAPELVLDPRARAFGGRALLCVGGEDDAAVLRADVGIDLRSELARRLAARTDDV